MNKPNEQKDKQTNKQTQKQTNVQTSKRTNAKTNKRPGKQTKKPNICKSGATQNFGMLWPLRGDPERTNK